MPCCPRRGAGFSVLDVNPTPRGSEKTLNLYTCLGVRAPLRNKSISDPVTLGRTMTPPPFTDKRQRGGLTSHCSCPSTASGSPKFQCGPLQKPPARVGGGKPQLGEDVCWGRGRGGAQLCGLWLGMCYVRSKHRSKKNSTRA